MPELLTVFFLGLAIGALGGMCIGALIMLEWRERIVQAAQEDNRGRYYTWHTCLHDIDSACGGDSP